MIWFLLKIIDNATIAAIFAVIIGAILGEKIYRRQKDIDREYKNKDKLIESCMILKEHCVAVNQGLDKLANTYRIVKTENTQKLIDDFKSGLRPELLVTGDVLMNKIPEDLGKIDTIISIYYTRNQIVKNSYDKIKVELKNWHDFVSLESKGGDGQKLDLTKRVADIPELSLKKLGSAINELIGNLN